MPKKRLLDILESEAESFFKKQEGDILDILLFGSTTKGKDDPNDIDILLIFKNKIDLASVQELRKLLEKNITIPVEVVPKTYPQLFKKDFVAREAILSGAYSLIYKTSIAGGLGYIPMMLFVYQLKGKTKSERMRFYYSLNGRTTKGILHLLRARRYTDTAIICPLETAEKMSAFFRSWMMDAEEMPVLIPERFLL